MVTTPALVRGADSPLSPQVWINNGDIILLSLRDFQDDKADVIVKYTADEARSRTSLRPNSADMASLNARFPFFQ